eukprot:CAMPEP_0172545746 /NCGR_PEP_ID=MMETSP1067-20121228/15616_1 /TAXON_ID=265564 ORGANISM="Thalassiosira punctigera, Strain Tpunct2005C2" /NCGR_SAMPLE_ID=MMETSP1067 /ASSEMBLY_ACC=CAM_ASM_000444 /LENGTH=300 /DNA_ID=CAMNT_0013332551 /DNA_START=165 /DNA_END=1067 /DNA_ORIENTATION=+
MVELLEPGTEAETCFMAGRGMNGLKGVVVCFNPNNQRYTLELEQGDMMSLRIRNVRKMTTNEDYDEAQKNANYGDGTGGTKPTPSTTSTGDDDNAATNSSLPSFPTSRPKVEADVNGRDTSDNQQINLSEMISPVNAILAALVAYFFFKSNTSNAPVAPSPHNHVVNYTFQEVSVPAIITFAVFAYLAWEWGTKLGCRPRGDFKLTNLSLRLSDCDFWEIMGIASLILWCFEYSIYSIVSVGSLFFFVWKFGTKNGRTRFSWDNVKERAANMSVWEAMWVARVLKEGLGVLNQMARHRRR